MSVDSNCRKCATPLQSGVYMAQTYSGIPDFPGGEVVTVSAGGPGYLLSCMKCPACGWSRTYTAEERQARMRHLGWQ